MEIKPHPKGKGSAKFVDLTGLVFGRLSVLRKVQALNMRPNVHVEAYGKKLTISEWSHASGIGPSTINQRIRAGWKPEIAVTKPPRKMRSRKSQVEHRT